ncbi:MAG: hypothetical protein ABEJ03_01000 [Candidatus Nanohaloarchaea archaeon]
MKGQSVMVVRALITVTFAMIIAVIGLKLVNTDQAVRVKTIDVASARFEGAISLTSSLDGGSTVQIDMGDTYVVSRDSGDRYIRYKTLPIVGQGLGKSKVKTPASYELDSDEIKSRHFCLEKAGNVVVKGGKC